METILAPLGVLVVYSGAVIGSNLLISSATSSIAKKKIKKKSKRITDPHKLEKIYNKEIRNSKLANIAIGSMASMGLSYAATSALDYLTTDSSSNNENNESENNGESGGNGQASTFLLI